MPQEFTHLDEGGRPKMVDVSAKAATLRVAEAEARIHLPPELLVRFKDGECLSPKGAVFQTATLAGIMAAKRTGELIPLCHPLGLDSCAVKITLEGEEAVIRTRASLHGRTGVEMEALTAASVAALTIYDMCKAVTRGLVIREIRLLAKSGGKEDWRAEA